jgi:hypothetical protein
MKIEKDEVAIHLDHGFIGNGSQSNDENSHLSKKNEERVYQINKKIEEIRTNYMTRLGNSISYVHC